MYMNKQLGRFLVILMRVKQSNLTVLAWFTNGSLSHHNCSSLKHVIYCAEYFNMYTLHLILAVYAANKPTSTFSSKIYFLVSYFL